jgi:hypothetical protein
MIKFTSLRGGCSPRQSNLLLIWRLLRAITLATTLLTSCTTLDAFNAAAPIPVTLTETALPTATIVWFPPSPSPQAYSTYAPTPEMRPGLSTILLNDNFSDPFLWDTAISDQASADIQNNRLTLAVQSDVTMTSLRHELIIDDYYAEITARPNVCRGDDSYGILVRANGGTYYRFALSCNGTVLLDRLSNGTKLNMLKPLPSGDVPPGAPGEVRIGIWAVGPDMRLFLNGRYQFSIIDKSYPIGTIGVFVKSAGETPTIVSFSDFMIREVDYVPPTSTPVP